MSILMLYRRLVILPSTVLLLVSFLGVSCIKNPATRETHARLLSPQAERKIGEETKKQILEIYDVYNSTPIANYVSSIGQKLAEVSDRPTVDYEFLVLDSDLINAFAAPGGFIFVTRGLLNAISDEAELAMVLGHEIAHVAALHGVQMIQKEMGQNALTILGSIGAALVAGPEAMLMVGKTGSLFSSLYLLGYSREKELEADNLGLQYMLRGGYDPQASLRFLEELEKGDDEKLSGWDLYFRTHPATSERIDIIEHMIGREDKPSAVRNKEEFQKIKDMLPRVNEEEMGKIDGTVYQNGFHHLTLQVPENWRLGRDHALALVSFATVNQEGQGRLQTIDLASTTINAEALAHEASRKLNLQFLSGRQVLYNAGYGFLGRYIGPSPRGQFLEYRMYVTIRNNLGYLLICGAPPQKIDSYILDMERIMRSLRFV